MPPELELMPQQLEVRTAPESFNAEERTVDVVFSRGKAVQRYSYRLGGYYLEELSMEPEHVRLDRLRRVGPVLDGHMGWSTRSQLGSVRTADVGDGECRATLGFRDTDEALEAVRGIEQGHVRAVSVGYRVHKLEDTGRVEGGLSVYRAVDWEPYEISLVPIPADDAVEMRDDALRPNPCQIIERHGNQGEQMPPETNIDDKTRSENTPPAAATPSAPEQRSEPATPPVDVEAERSAAIEEERKRSAEIMKLCARHGVSEELRSELIEKGRSLEQARAQILDSLAERDEETEVNGRVSVGREDLGKRLAAVENAIEHRLDPSVELTDGGAELRSYSMLELGRSLLQARGVAITGVDRMRLAGMILGRAHSTSDFPKLFENIASKRLLKAYREAEPTFDPITDRATLPDFKPAGRARLSDAPALQKRDSDGGEYKSGTLNEWSAQNQLDDYGVIVELTRKALINDDLGAFDRTLQKMSRRARHLEEDLVWGVLLENATMSDSKALFHADHGNELTSTALNITGLGSAVEKLRLMTDSQGTVLNLRPKYLVVPPALESTARQLTSDQVVPANITNFSPFRGQMDVIVEPRLQAGVTIDGAALSGNGTRWFLAAEKADVDILEIATLDGMAGPRLEQDVDFRTDGVAFKVGHDAGAAILDYRGLIRATA